MCLSETDSHKKKKMTSESPRYIPTTSTTSSYKSDRSTTHFDGPNTRAGGSTIRSTHHDLVHDARRLDNPQDLYRQYRNEHLDSTTVGGGPGRSLSGNLVRRPETSSKARRLAQNAAKRTAADRGLTAPRAPGGDDEGGGDNYTQVPAPAADHTPGHGAPGLGHPTGAGARDTRDGPSSAIRNHGDRDDRDRGGHHSHSHSHSHSHYDSGTGACASTNTSTSTNRDRGQHPSHRHRERHGHFLRPPKERVTTYVQDNIIMRISSASHSHSYSQLGAHHHSYPTTTTTTTTTIDDPYGMGQLSSSNSNSISHNPAGRGNGRGNGGADHRRKWYRERMARIIQDIEPGLPPSSGSGRGRGYSGSGAGGAGGYGSSGGAGGYVYSGMGMGSGAGAGGYSSGAGAGGYGAAGTGGGYGSNGRDSGYGSFSGSGSYGRGH